MKTGSPEALLDRLEEAVQGLLFPSESDFPLIPLVWGHDEPTAEALARASGHGEEAPVEAVDVKELFAPVLEPPEGDEAAAADAERTRRLLSLLEAELTSLRAFRVGRVEIDVYVLGQHPTGAWVGLRTKVIET